MFQTFLAVRQKGKEPNHAPACSSARFQHPVPPDLESLSDALWTLVPGKKIQPGLNKTVYCYKSIQFANLATTTKMQQEYMKSQGRNFLWPMSYNQRNDISAKTDHKRSQNNILFFRHLLLKSSNLSQSRCKIGKLVERLCSEGPENATMILVSVICMILREKILVSSKRPCPN